jgi:hypothetical protein
VNILKAKNINRKYKVVIYKTLIKPVLMHGAETWVLSKADELRLGVFERKIVRRIYGLICDGAIWRSRYNELYRLYDETDLVTTIRITRLRWGGHIVRIIIVIFINCNWVVTRWQYTFKHKQYTEQHK